MLKHLEFMIDLAGSLGATVAVFGSPKNRIKGELTPLEANEMATRFFNRLAPCLAGNNVVLTLEPNAPAYGADFLVTYEEVVDLAQQINSPNIRPQIDTGCLWMVGVQPEDAYKLMTPQHIHLSTPFLGEVPGNHDFNELLNVVKSTNYKGWLVIEMLSTEGDNLIKALDSAKWLTSYIRRY
jgi:sugar phosphate isomerase/epimerase